MVKKVSLSLALLTLLLTLVPSSWARTALEPSKSSGGSPTALVSPAFCMTEHNVGKMVLAVTNYGCFGDGFSAGSSVNCFTGMRVLSCEYPKGSRTRYNFASSFWFGAILGRDTLVSVGADGWFGGSFEMFPDEAGVLPPRKDGSMIFRSIMDPTAPEFTDAISEQDYIAVYTDTFTSGVPGLPLDEITKLPHTPLGIEVTQRSFAWSYPYAEDFVLFDYAIKNIGNERLRDVYMGVYCDADIMGNNQQGGGYDDDISGFIEAMETKYGGGTWLDTVNIAWTADNSGKLNMKAGSDVARVPNVTATRIVRTPSDSLKVSFNWWVSNGDASRDYGPQRKGQVRDLFHGGLGTPGGDRSKYAFLSNGEFDFDQIFTASILPNDSMWAYPNPIIAKDLSDGYDTRYLLSFGPFNIDPGQTLPLSLAYVGGENLHTELNNQSTYLNGNKYFPDLYYDNLDFSDLALNSVWASWIYDNPGIDSDSDGYAGEFRILCLDSSLLSIDTIIVDTPLIDTTIDTTWAFNVCDTVWYKGDGVPDFRGASPPPAPKVWAYPETGRIRVRWNGLRSETTRDVFSRQLDFEGYRVYLARDDRNESYSILASYDREDYNKYVYNRAKNAWELFDVPYTLENLRCIYGASCDDMGFDPERYSRPSSPYIHPSYPDSIFYFKPQDFNRSELGITTPIRKIYPDQQYPSSLNPDSAATAELTEDGFLKYFEYEFVIENLLPTIPYYINVTAMDYGSPQSGLASLETSKTINAKYAYPLPTVQDVEEQGLEVYVYPNPYVGDGAYAARGYEGYDNPNFTARDTEHIRRLHFANLPAKCTIRIFSIDGDLIRELEHDMSPSDPAANHDKWDMITRNTQAIVSGIYYWTVEDTDGNIQIGKFVVIL